jgi:hypothetical protein
MSNVEALNTVDLNNAQTKELVNTPNVKAELSEEQLYNVNGGRSQWPFIRPSKSDYL